MTQESTPQKPSNVRHGVLFATALVAVVMYLDRVCMAQLADQIRDGLALEKWQMDWVLGTFFWSYALCQVPAAWVADRLGFRHSLTLYLVVWSLFTAGTGLATGFGTLIVARLLVGMAQAGGYPTAASILGSWYPLQSRGRASSVVALGGRVGWIGAQYYTPFLLVAVVAWGVAPWRSVLVVYGLLGLGGGLLFWLIARDNPYVHPWSNSAEAALTGTSPPGKRPAGLSFATLVMSENLWLSSIMQFGVNMGWTFLVTLLPSYLTERFDVSLEERGRMAAVPAAVSCVGMFLGGFVTDAMMRRFGLRWGRSVPMAAMMVVCASAYLACMGLKTPWGVVIALSVMAMGVDLAVPALWAFAQDIGGRNAGAALGWGNMWGNVGSALSPVVLGAIQRSAGWNMAFLTCALAFAAAGCCALLMDASRPLVPEAEGARTG